MPVIGVLVETGVGHEHEIVANFVGQIAQRHLHHSVGRVRRAAARILGRRNTEQDHARDSQIGERAHLLAEALLRVLHHTRHRLDRLRFANALLHEERRDEVVDVQASLGHEPPEGRRSAQAARPLFGEAHDARLPITRRCQRVEHCRDQAVDRMGIGLRIHAEAPGADGLAGHRTNRHELWRRHR